MASADPFADLGRPDELVKLVPDFRLERVSLTAEQGFVLSRIDGRTDLQTLCMISGLGEAKTASVLQALVDSGVIFIGDRAPKLVPSAAEDQDPPPGPTDKDSTQDKARALLRSQIEHDDPAIDVKAEVRLTILQTFSGLGEATFFDLLGVAPDAEIKQIRRAYFARSKLFHPDRYYSRTVGRYGPMLAEIFKQVSSAYQFLENDKQRSAYRETIEQQVKLEQQAIRVERQAIDLLGQQGLESLSAETESGSTAYQYTFVRRQLSPTHEGLPRLEPEMLARTAQGSSAGRQQPPTQPMFREAAAGLGPLELPPEVAEEELDEEQEPADPALTHRRAEDRRRRRFSVAQHNPHVARKKRAGQFYNQGQRQLDAGEYLAAAASLKLAMSFDPESVDYRKRYEEAVDHSRGATAEGHFKRALFEESVGRYEAACHAYVRAADLFPRATYLQKAGQALLRLHDLIKAKDYATKAVQADQTDVDARLVLAEVYLAAGLKRNALREAEQALKLAPDRSDAKELLKKAKRA
jgi:curved DNA-binding protein CbpA